MSTSFLRSSALLIMGLSVATGCSFDAEDLATDDVDSVVAPGCSTNRGLCPANLASGVYATSDATLVSRERFVGSNFKYAVLFPVRKTANQLVSSIAGSISASGRNLGAHAERVTYSWTIAPIFYGEARFNAKTEAGRTLVRQHLLATANGDNDEGFRRVAAKLKEIGQGESIVRLGHEMTGEWFQWSAVGNCDAFASAWRRVYTVMKSVSPGLKFDFTVAGSRNNAQLAPCAWPGDSYVDIVGVDFYDRGAAASHYDAEKPGWIDPARTWSTYHLKQLDTMRAFAIAHNKPLSIPEWGLEGEKGDGGGIEGRANVGGDNPYFVQSLYNWMNMVPRGAPGGILYHAYFWAHPSGEGPHNLDDPTLAEAAAKYRQLFGR